MPNLLLIALLQAVTPAPTLPPTPIPTPTSWLSPPWTGEAVTIFLSVLGIVVAILGVWVGILQHRTARARAAAELKLSAAEDKIDKFKDYARTHTVIRYVNQDIILLGPRDSGKTCVAKLWTEPWFDVKGVSHTEGWDTYQASIYSLSVTDDVDELFGVPRKYETILRIVIHDCPGENDYQMEAVRKLPMKKDAVLLLFFDLNADESGVILRGPIEENLTYYNKSFIEELDKQRNLRASVKKAIIVFNKIDLLPPEWSRQRMLDTLRRENHHAIRRIEEIFGYDLDIHLVSATRNTGMISLLGEVGSAGQSGALQEQLKQKIKSTYPEPAAAAPAGWTPAKETRG